MEGVTVDCRVATRDDGRAAIEVHLDAPPAYPECIWMALPVGMSERDVDPAVLGDIALAIGLLPASLEGLPLNGTHPASPRLRRNLATYLDILATWYPGEFHRVAISAPDRAARIERDRPRVAVFFTGGVDSFHSYLTQRETIDALVNVDGFDVDLSLPVALDQVHRHLNRIAAESGTPLLSFASNARELLVPFADWGRATHGMALGFAALVLSALGFDRVLVPSTAPYDRLAPWGSHPLLDVLWSTEDLDVVHTGAGAHRGTKIAAIAGDPLAQQHLRVCWEHPDQYNCSRCEKCVRTMSLLEATGQRDAFATFDRDVDLARLANRPLRDDNERGYAVLIIQTLAENDRAPHVAASYARRVREFDRRTRRESTIDRSLGRRRGAVRSAPRRIADRLHRALRAARDALR